MTCICGHHEHAHLSDIGLCAAPEGCNCNHFHKPAPNPDPFVDETAAAKRFAEMTDAELWQWWMGGAGMEGPQRIRGFAALRDAIRAEAIHESAMNDDEMRTQLRIRAERAEQERDAWEVSCHNATIEKHEALALAPSGVTEAMVERFIAAMDVASDADVGREEGIRYALSAALAEARKDSERLDWLERHQGRVSGPALDNPRWVVWADDAANDVEADNFRDAIDRARRTLQLETPE